MATQSEKIQKLQDEIKSYKETLIKYGDMFNADGVIEEHEQKKLDQMQSIIQKVEKKLVALKEKAEKKEQDNKGTNFPTVKMKEIGDFLTKLEAKFGIK
ncbi:hypothetical protein [Aureispira sp. CCB-E]|uniref:hypothetical protein n=1 Tax=Aureispira sp. CCB-E TaxID=3051121 RepID=UPI00286964A3|nr:hypothetical protein [Aureispira sp. CCB-E]WMX15037.1 hypothetical protein QP953_01480 [Aureispira sp. CCB-E]